MAICIFDYRDAYFLSALDGTLYLYENHGIVNSFLRRYGSCVFPYQNIVMGAVYPTAKNNNSLKLIYPIRPIETSNVLLMALSTLKGLTNDTTNN